MSEVKRRAGPIAYLRERRVMEVGALRMLLVARRAELTAAVGGMSEEEFLEAYKVWRTEYMRRWRARRRGDG